ncbi:MAG TPA: hypothetical protein VFV47_00805 [Hyphomicrobiaceae bacterium]|nr:hypothetical protein [Hyphomicrobiaceae bacterium]
MYVQNGSPLIVRSRVTPWGFLVALPLAAAFVLTGGATVDAAGLMPERLGVFVAPPSWVPGILLIGFGLFLSLIGVAELARYLSPTVELVVDRSGLATYGLLGQHRLAWDDISHSQLAEGVLSLRSRQNALLRSREVRIHFNRLDLSPPVLLAHIRTHRPDLVPPAETGL